MGLSIANKIGRIYRGLASVTAFCLLSISRHESSRDDREGRAAELFCRSPLVEGGTVNIDADRSREGLALNPVAIFSRVIGAFPLPGQPIQPAIYREYLACSTKIIKEVLLDFGVKCITAKPAPPRPDRGIEWFHKSGLERPRATFTLARDDLDSAVVPA